MSNEQRMMRYSLERANAQDDFDDARNVRSVRYHAGTQIDVQFCPKLLEAVVARLNE